MSRWAWKRLLRRSEREKTADLPALTDRGIIDAFHQAYYNSSERTWRKTYWMGVPVLKCPLDLWIYQEILLETRPDVVIETGTFWGGSALFFASIFELLGSGRVITIDTAPQPERPEHGRIIYLTGSSISKDVVAAVRSQIEEGEKVMAVLDSNHTAPHVLQEMNMYKDFVSRGGYMIVEDTNINGHPVLADFGPGPAEAVQEFLRNEPTFVRDEAREKFGLTFSPGGYLRRT